MIVDDLRPWITKNKDALLTALLDESYKPQPVRGVEIPKPGGGKRQSRIPTVVDRLVQQAMLQVLKPRPVRFCGNPAKGGYRLWSRRAAFRRASRCRCRRFGAPCRAPSLGRKGGSARISQSMPSLCKGINVIDYRTDRRLANRSKKSFNDGH
jgi:hypothetical protein